MKSIDKWLLRCEQWERSARPREARYMKERDVYVAKPDGVNVSDDLRFFLGVKVWSGLYDSSDILEIAMDTIADELFEEDADIEEGVVREMIGKAMEQKQSEEKNWPAETDCDRLSRAFRELTLRGIVCVENAGYTMSEGWEDFRQAVDDAGWEHNAVRGGCFYHGQDLERVVLGYELWLAFGATTEGDDKDIAIAEEIIEVLKSHGFSPVWDGTVDKRIAVPINWQRRFGPIADTSPPDRHLQK